MRKVLKISTIILSILAMVTLMLPSASSAAASPDFPSSINGLPVIMIQTPANTASLATGRIITVLDNLSSTKEEAMQRFSSTIESVKSILSPGDIIEVYGGPQASKEQYVNIHAENDKYYREFGPFKPSIPRTTVESKETADSATLILNPGFAAFTDDDPSSVPPICIVQGISAQMDGINIGTSQNSASYFLVNGLTESAYFLQSGQAYFQNGARNHIWADSSTQNLKPQLFNLAYITNHQYLYDITYMGSPGVWEMGVKDQGTGAFNLIIEYNGQGSQLQKNPNTSVFFENWNTNANWWNGFPMWIIA